MEKRERNDRALILEADILATLFIPAAPKKEVPTGKYYCNFKLDQQSEYKVPLSIAHFSETSICLLGALPTKYECVSKNHEILVSVYHKHRVRSDASLAQVKLNLYQLYLENKGKSISIDEVYTLPNSRQFILSITMKHPDQSPVSTAHAKELWKLWEFSSLVNSLFPDIDAIDKFIEEEICKLWTEYPLSVLLLKELFIQMKELFIQLQSFRLPKDWLVTKLRKEIPAAFIMARALTLRSTSPVNRELPNLPSSSVKNLQSLQQRLLVSNKSNDLQSFLMDLDYQKLWFFLKSIDSGLDKQKDIKKKAEILSYFLPKKNSTKNNLSSSNYVLLLVGH